MPTERVGLTMKRASVSPSNRTLFALFAIVILTVALRAPLLNIPLERDEGVYAYIAYRLDYNELPYRDWFDHKPPGVFWAYRLALALPFDSVFSIHLIAMAVSAGTGVALFFLARRLFGNSTAMLAALLFAALSADPAIQGQAANTEIFMLLPMVLANLLVLRLVQEPRSNAIFPFATGLLYGLATIFKQVAGANWLALLASVPWLLSPPRRFRGTGSLVLWSILGIAISWGAVAAFFWSRGAFPDLVYNVFTHNLRYSSSLPVAERWEYLKDTLLPLARSQTVVWIFAGAGLIAAFSRSDRRLLAFLGAWLFGSLVGVSTSGYYFPHYFQQLLPPVALLAAFGAQALSQGFLFVMMPVRWRQVIGATALLALPCLSLAPFVFFYSPTEAVQHIYPGNSFGYMQEFARFIKDTTEENDRIYVFGADPELLFYARRASATRYIFLSPLYNLYPDSLEKQQATAREIFTAHPAVVVYRPIGLFFHPGNEQYLTRWTDTFLNQHYKPMTIYASDHRPMELYTLRK
jgi:4-amino-4-deoxy-L-arabinose transferase-like glycosyltransferase